MQLQIWIKLFIAFFEIGFMGFGGGYAMLSMIFEKSADFGMTVAQFADLNAVDMLIPGPIAINSATYVGYLYGGFLGSLIATIAVLLPTCLFVFVCIKLEAVLTNNIYLSSALHFAKITSVGLITAVALSLGLSAIFNVDSIHEVFSIQTGSWFSFIVIIITGILHLKFDINPIALTIFAGISGYILYYVC